MAQIYYDMEIPRRMTDTEYLPPSNLSITFTFDNNRSGLTLDIAAAGLPLSYLGRGKIAFSDGYIRMTALSVIDPFLITRSFVPGKNLKIFLKAIYPKLLRENLPVSIDIRLHELPPVTISVTEVSNESVSCHIRWVEGGQNAVAIDGMDGYVLAGKHIYKGSLRYLDLVPKRVSGTYTLTGDEAKQLGKLCDFAGYMFCGTNLSDLRSLGRGVRLSQHDTIEKQRSFDDLFADLTVPSKVSSADPATETVPVSAVPVIKPVTKTFDGPALLSVRTKASVREMNAIAARFAADAIQYGVLQGSPCSYVPLTSYWPTYSGMNESQKQYYLYFRTAFMAGETPKTDLSYIFIAIYEILNHGIAPSEETCRTLLRYWTAYRAKFPRLDLYVPRWAVDYILTNDLPISLYEIARAVPEAASQYAEIIDAVLNDGMKEGLHAMPVPLWRYFCTYEVSTSKLWNGPHREVFETTLRTVFRVLDQAVRKAKNTSLLTLYLPPEEKKEYTSYTGAVCARQYRRSLRLTYHPITKSGKLHTLLENAVKYTENALRTRYKIMGRLRVGTLPEQVRTLIDAVLAQKDPAELPQKKPLVIDIAQAAQLEQSSWDNTKKLLDAIEPTDDVLIPDAESVTARPEPTADSPMITASESANADGSETETFFHKLTELQREFLFAVMDGTSADILDTICANEFLLPDAVADEINEQAADYFGDIILDNSTIIEDYIDFLTQQREAYHA